MMEIDQRVFKGLSVHKGIADLSREGNHAYTQYLKINGYLLYWGKTRDEGQQFHVAVAEMGFPKACCLKS